MRTTWRKVAPLSAAVMVGIAPWIAFAQAGAAFEVASVPEAKGGNNTRRVSRTPQRLAFQATQAGDIIAFAYGFPPDRVERRPQWMYDDSYDVAVTTAGPTTLAEQKLMLQKLLEERFGLVVHRLSYEGAVYFLVPGAEVKLTETKEADAVDLPQFRPKPFQPGTSPGPPDVVYEGRHVSMGDLAAWLYSPMGVPVVDKTGITGLFDIEIAVGIRGGAERFGQAVRSQLGLDLQWKRGTVETLIIDHVEKPGVK